MLLQKGVTGSTNDDARALALAGAPHGAGVLALAQTAGRGRAGRAFASPQGGLYLSVVLRPKAPPESWSLLPLAAGAAFADALGALGFPARLKWPNDLLLDGRKVGGVLVESRLGEAPFAVVGVGINRLRAPPEAPEATALARHGEPPPPRALAEALVARLLEECASLDAHGAGPTLARVRAACDTLGRRVAWDEGAGVAVDVDGDGALVVEDEGRRTRVVAGDVRVRLG